MAPVCLVRRLTQLTLICFMLVLTSVTRTIDSLLVYDRQELLKIKDIVNSCAEYNCYGPNKPRPSYLADVPAYLLRVRVLLPRKRIRQGVRGGRLVKLKSWLALFPEFTRSPDNVLQDYEDCFH
ncbi:hypothetical protein DPX16_23774 [Anabarilius grahami]|uniref:Uncharacterized protein n=1 Tax=Anabarilius grahami TaxID=495550 RepID=A0A3N0XWS5_ANAGA|nr:hypothetical protein DPX16_23774 [Anabarilius grahami]